MKKMLEVDGIILIGEEEDLIKRRRTIVAGSIRAFEQSKYYKEEDPVECLEKHYDDLGVWSHDFWREMSRQLGEDFKA